MARVGPHRRRLGLRDPALARRSRGLPASHQRLRARDGRADASPRPVQRGLLAGARRPPGDGHGGDDVSARGVRRSSMYRSLIRSDERLDYDRVDRIFAGAEAAAEPWGEPLAAARAASAVLGELRRAGSDRGGQGRARSRSTPPSPSSASTATATWSTAELSEQTESHRLIEQLMIAANEQVAKFLADHKIPALYRVHERPEAPAVERLIDQLESLGVPTPPVPKGHLTPQQAADVVGEASVTGRRLGAPDRPRPPGADQPGAALAQAGLLRPAQPRPRRAGARRATAISPRRSAAIRTSSAIGRCSARSPASRRPTPPGWRAPPRGPPSASARR